MTFNLYTANVRGQAQNKNYPNIAIIKSLEDLEAVVKHDHIAGRMKDGQRSIENFLESDVLLFDLDNTHSEDPEEWKNLDDIADALPEVAFYAVPSRNHNKVKSKWDKRTKKNIYYAARPKYHIYLPLSWTVNAAEYTDLSMKILALFPYFDPAATDPARFFFGVDNPEAYYYTGELCANQYTEQLRPEAFTALTNESCMIEGVEAAAKKLREYFKVQEFMKPADPTPEALEWIEAAEQQKSIAWLKAWAKQYAVTLGTCYTMNTSSHPNAIAFCVPCPWAAEHTEEGPENESVIIIERSGKLCYLCRHGHCTGRGWKEYRDKTEREHSPAKGDEWRITEGWHQHQAERQEKINLAIAKAFKLWAVGVPFTREQIEWLNKYAEYATYERDQDFFAYYGYLDDDGVPTESGQQIIDADDVEALLNSPQADLFAKGEKIPAETQKMQHRAKYSASDYLTSGTFAADIQYFQNYRDRKAGIHPNIDRYLTLYPGLAVLGGASSLGKTTFAVNLIDKLLERGETVLFFTLEQLPIEIITKSLARRLHDRDPYNRITNLDIKNGATSDALERVKREYAAIAENYYIFKGSFKMTAADIAEQVAQFIQEKQQTPVVIVDYLQLIAPPADFRGGIREAIDENLKALKDLQIRHGLFMLIISSFNRSSNLEPVSYEAFKESSMIEFTCDYVFGLQLTIQDPNHQPSLYYRKGPQGGRIKRQEDEQRQMIHDAQAANPKQVQFVSLKNRNGRQFFTANFDYYPQYDAYVPENDFKEYDGPDHFSDDEIIRY